MPSFDVLINSAQTNAKTSNMHRHIQPKKNAWYSRPSQENGSENDCFICISFNSSKHTTLFLFMILQKIMQQDVC